MALNLFSQHHQIIFDLLHRDELVGENLERRIDDIAEDDGTELTVMS